MSDEVARHFEQEKSDVVSPPGRSLTLSITLHPNNQIDFQFPASNKVVAYGLLEVARAQLDKMYLLGELQHVQASRGGIDGLLKRMNGGK